MTDWDVRVLTAGGWKTVAKVRDNTAASRTSTFTPVTATKVQIVAREVEAYLDRAA